MGVLSFTQADADVLKAAILTGAKAVKYADKEVIYRTLDEMERTLEMIEASLNEAAGNTNTRKRVGQFCFKK